MDHGIVGHGLLYEEVLRVPLIFSGPDVKQNVINSNLTCHLDLAPTLCELSNIPIDKNYKGKSLFNILTNNNDDPIRDHVIAEGVQVNQYSYRDQNYKYMVYYDQELKMINEELYNIKKDKQEKNKIKDPVIISTYRNIILDHISKTKDLSGKDVMIDLDEWQKKIMKDRLKKLGYLE
jgi:choline-sulfatase